MDYAKLAQQYGGAAMPDAPAIAQPSQPDWMEGLSPKDQAELKMKMNQEARKRLASLDEEISIGGRTMDMLNRYGQLNRQARTGGLHEKILPNWKGFRGDEEQEMIAIQSFLAPKMRETGSGSTSDRDVSMFMSALPSIENKGSVNKNIRKNFESQYTKALAKKTAMENYLNEKGDLTGFDEFWVNQNKASQASSGKNKPASRLFKLDGGGSVAGYLGADGYYYTKDGKQRIEE